MKSTQKISKTFISFLVASILIWLLITLSKEYTASLFLGISYDELPEDKILQKEPVNEIEVLVKGTGFRIIVAKLKNNLVKLNTSNLTRKSKLQYYLIPKNQKSTIQKQLSSGLQIEQILKDTIYLELGSLISKKVPVKLHLDIEYHLGYDSSTAIQLTPDSIAISGPESQVNEIHTIHLSDLKLEDVTSDFENIVPIIKPKNSEKVSFSGESVKITGNVEKFTEGSFEVSYAIKNLPKELEIRTFPKTIKVVYKVGLSNFNKIDENSFKIECDYKTATLNNYNYLLPKVVSTSGLIKSVKLIPNKIDFLIQK
ncbi:MAG: hypothetical protein ACPGTO_04845 [Polaribacter sp.]